jgi:hypothetical protein
MDIISAGGLAENSIFLTIFKFHETNGAGIVVVDRFAIVVGLVRVNWNNRRSIIKDSLQLGREIRFLPVICGFENPDQSKQNVLALIAFRCMRTIAYDIVSHKVSMKTQAESLHEGILSILTVYTLPVDPAIVSVSVGFSPSLLRCRSRQNILYGNQHL